MQVNFNVSRQFTNSAILPIKINLYEFIDAFLFLSKSGYGVDRAQ